MADYLNKIAAAKADIARLKGEKEAFEQSNAPDDADEEELASWNYARELERQVRELTNAFVDELKGRCAVMSEDENRALVLELFAQDVQDGLNAAVGEKRQELVRFVEGLWNKYKVTLTDLRGEWQTVEERLEQFMEMLTYQ